MSIRSPHPELRIPDVDFSTFVLERAAAEKLWIAPDCGFFSTPRWIAAAKLQAMVQGAEIVRGELASG